MYIDFKAGNEVYKLRLRTRDIITMEKQIGVNPLAIFGNGETIPTITTMVTILHASLQAYQHNITLDKAFDIFDEWLEDNHTMLDFVAVILEVYKVSGLIRQETKN
jgi:hypothetical protein